MTTEEIHAELDDFIVAEILRMREEERVERAKRAVYPHVQPKPGAWKGSGNTRFKPTYRVPSDDPFLTVGRVNSKAWRA